MTHSVRWVGRDQRIIGRRNEHPRGGEAGLKHASGMTVECPARRPTPRQPIPWGLGHVGFCCPRTVQHEPRRNGSEWGEDLTSDQQEAEMV